jgi:hypothetical protein
MRALRMKIVKWKLAFYVLAPPHTLSHLDGRCGGDFAGRRDERAAQCLPAPAPKRPIQGVRGGEHLPATASKREMQGVP